MQVLIIILAIAASSPAITVTTQEFTSPATCNAARERIADDLKRLSNGGIGAIVYCAPK